MLMDTAFENNEKIFRNGMTQKFSSNETILKDVSWNDSARISIYYIDEELEKEMQAFRQNKIMLYYNEISSIIKRDEYIDGEVSQSEIFMQAAYENGQMDYVMEALMQIYSKNLLNSHELEGVLMMISCVPYEAVEPKGQVMAIGLLSNKELLIRDRAIQCFERWNSKKGLMTLKSLDCQPNWLQNYVDKVIMYIERDGVD